MRLRSPFELRLGGKTHRLQMIYYKNGIGWYFDTCSNKTPENYWDDGKHDYQTSIVFKLQHKKWDAAYVRVPLKEYKLE